MRIEFNEELVEPRSLNSQAVYLPITHGDKLSIILEVVSSSPLPDLDDKSIILFEQM